MTGKIEKVDINDVIEFLEKCDGQKMSKMFKNKLKSRPPKEIYAYNDNGIKGFYATKETKDNLQITFDVFFVDENERGKGIGENLFIHFLDLANLKKKYIRISSEKNALQFYEKMGIKFLCKQKSGTSLTLFRIDNGKFNFTIDSFIEKKMKAKIGGCND